MDFGRNGLAVENNLNWLAQQMSMKNIVVTILLLWCASSTKAQQVRVKLGRRAELVLVRSTFKPAGVPLRWEKGKMQPTLAGQPVFGTDGEMPRFILTAATAILDGKPIKLNTRNMYNPWFGDSPDAESCKLVRRGNTARLLALFSDGAGTYLAEWQIANGVAKRIVLTTDEDVIVSHFYGSAK